MKSSIIPCGLQEEGGGGHHLWTVTESVVKSSIILCGLQEEGGGESVEEDIIVDDGDKPDVAAITDSADAATPQKALQHMCAQAEVIAEQSVGESSRMCRRRTSPHHCLTQPCLIANRLSKKCAIF